SNYMAQSAKAIINVRRIRRDRKARIYLRVTIDRKIKDINLGIVWYPAYFMDGECLSLSNTTDKSVADLNLIIGDARARASEIFIQYRLRRKMLTMNQFLTEFATNLNKDDFLAFYEFKMMQRLKEGEIELSTKINHQVTLNHLRNWRKNILFSELDDRTAYQIEK